MMRPLFYATKLFSQIKLDRVPTDYDQKGCSWLKIFLEASCLATRTSQAYSHWCLTTVARKPGTVTH